MWLFGQWSVDRSPRYVFRFTDCKLHSIDSSQDAAVVLRTIASQKLNKILLREYRPHLLASSVTYEPNSADPVIRRSEYLCCNSRLMCLEFSGDCDIVQSTLYMFFCRATAAWLHSAALAVMQCLVGCLSRLCIVSKQLKIGHCCYGMQIGNQTQLSDGSIFNDLHLWYIIDSTRLAICLYHIHSLYRQISQPNTKANVNANTNQNHNTGCNVKSYSSNVTFP